MKQIYKDIWKLAKPYYEIGRPQDIEHIEWLIKKAELVSKKENLDDSLLIPLVILHDIGYSKIPKDNSFKKNIRKTHMKEGAIITKEILEKLNYDKEKRDKIIYYVSIHDKWALGDDFEHKRDKILATFNDLDFMWMFTKKGFDSVRKMVKKNPKEMFGWIKNDEKLVKRPFKTKTTKKLWKKYFEQRKKELNK